MFTMSYFLDEDQTLRIAKGPDLFHFTDCNNNEPVLDLRPEGNIIRDPFIRKVDGVYHLFFTDNWNSDTLGYSKSTDLVNWAKPIHIPVMGENSDVANCWAPELCWDSKRNSWMLFWSTSFYSKNTDNRISNRIWYCHTKDFKTYTPAAKLFDPGYQVIDASICPYKGGYYMAFKDERGHNAPGTNYAAIRTAWAKDITGPYDQISELLTAFRTEGPYLIEEDGWFYMFYDSFGNQSYGGLRTRDFQAWEDISSQINFPKDCKHLCIIEDNE